MSRMIFTRVSSNKKTGAIPVSYSQSYTCPDACPLKGDKSCYAMGGNTGMHWRKLDKNEWGMEWEEFIRNIACLPKGQIWRNNVAGDLPGVNDTIDHDKLDELIEANRKSRARGFSYTHKPVGFGNIRETLNAKAVDKANKSGFTINLSADNLAEADELAKLGVGPVVTVLPSDAPRHMKTPEGRQVSVCPAEFDETGMDCSRCKLCSIPDRKVIIGFRAHGASKNKINKRFLDVVA